MKKIFLLGVVIAAAVCASFAKTQEAICTVTVKSPPQTYEKLKKYVSAVDDGTAMLLNMFSITLMGAPNYSGIDKDSSMAICVFMDNGIISPVLAIKASDSSQLAMSVKSSQSNFLRLDEWLVLNLAEEGDILPPKTFADYAYKTVKAASRGSLNSDISLSLNIPPQTEETLKNTLSDEYSKLIESAVDQLKQVKLNFTFEGDNLQTQLIFKAKDGSSFAEAINAVPLRKEVTETGFIDEKNCAVLSWGGIDFKKALKPCKELLDTLLGTFYSEDTAKKLATLIYSYADSSDGTFASVIYDDLSAVNIYKSSMDFDSALEMNYLATKISVDYYAKIFDASNLQNIGVNIDKESYSNLRSKKEVFPEDKFGAKAGLIEITPPVLENGKKNSPILNYIAQKDGYIFYASDEKILEKTLSKSPSKGIVPDCDIYTKIYLQRYAKACADMLGEKMPDIATPIEPLEMRMYFGDNRISTIMSLKASNVKAIVGAVKSFQQQNANALAAPKN